MSPSLEAARLAVLARYGVAVEGLRWAPLGSGGGFSGAELWRGDDSAGAPVFALKAWPAAEMTAARLEGVHARMKQAAHLPYVPTVLATRDNCSAVAAGGHMWDITRWMSGTANFHADPNSARLANAVAALARLHHVWRPTLPTFAPCPAVARRLRVLADWESVRPALNRPLTLGHAGLEDAARRGVAAVSRHARATREALHPWANRPVPVQPCLCDVRHDHVLFSDTRVTGVIDYGAVKDDHVAVDLARLLGELIGDDDARFAAGLDAYRDAGGTPDPPAEFVRLLDRSGVVCGVIVWLLRLVIDGRVYPYPEVVAARLDHLLSRLGALPRR
jgi:homoserine kinase type II